MIRADMVTVFIARPAEKGGHEFLQLRRRSADYMGGTWQTVRGAIESNETAAQAALRELREETNLIPFEFYGLSSIDSFYTAASDTIWHCPVFFALIAPTSKVQLNDEHDASRWIAADQVDGSFMWTRERELIREIVREILNSGLCKPHLLMRL